MKKNIYFLSLLSFIILVLIGCAKDDGGSSSSSTASSAGSGSAVSTAPALSGTVSGSSSSSSRILSEAGNYSHILGRSSERSSYSSVSSCTAKAYDPKDDSLVATVAAADNGTYTFTDGQLTKGVMYRVSVECTYGGQTVKMSTYGAAKANTNDNATTADIDPQSTAAAAYVKKALVKAVVKGLGSSTATGTAAEKREKTLSDLNSLVNNLQTTVTKNMADGAMEYPDDPTKVTTLEDAVAATSITSITDSSAGSSFETAMSNAQADDDWYVPPTLDAELDGAAAEGAAKLICAPWSTIPESSSDQEAQIKECAKIIAETSLLGLKWKLIIKNDDTSWSALWGVASCNSTDFGFSDSIAKYELKTHSDGSTSCKISNRVQAKSKNGGNTDGSSFTMSGKFYYKLAEHVKKDTKYTLQDINNMVFKKSGSGSSQIGWGGYWIVQSGAVWYAYTSENGFKPWVNLQNWPPTFGSVSGTSPTDTFANKFAGTVPSWAGVKDWVKNTKTHLPYNTIQSETYVIITEEPKRGKETNGDSNYCQDKNPATTCTTQKGNSIDDKKITVGLTFTKLASGDVSNNPQRVGFRYISSVGSKHTTQTKNQKNFYLRPLYDTNGATGAFGLVSAKNGRSLRNPWGYDVSLVIVQSANWCNSASAKFNYTLDNGSTQSLGCDSNSVGKALELWTSYDSDGGATYTIPKDSPSLITITDSALSSQLTASKEYHFRRGASTEYSFKCSLNPNDDCADGATDEYPSNMNPIVYGDWGGTNYLKFTIVDNGTTNITFDNASGTHYAEESWDCSGSTCSQKFLFFPKDARTVNSEAKETDLILYRGDNASLMTDTRYGVKAYQVNGLTMSLILDSINGSAAYGSVFDAHYFQGPIANPNWNSDKDPWKVTGKGGTDVTFTSENDLGHWFQSTVYASRELSAADMTARCSYFDNGSNNNSTSSYQTLCNGLNAQSNLSEAIENLRWQAINWSNLTGSGDGPFVPADDSSKSLRDKWQVVNYAREALWKRELSSSQKNTRCALFSTSVTTDTGNVNLKTLCESAVAATTAPDNFWTAMKTNCFGVWNGNTQTTAPVLGQDKCINSDNNTALNNLTGSNAASIDIDGDGTADSVKKWEKWKLINKGTEAVWNRSLTLTVRQNRCSNLSYDNATSSADSAFDNVPTSMKDLCLAAVNSDGAITSFDDAMSALSDGPFINWSATADNGSKKILVDSGTQSWDKTYKLIYDNNTVATWDNSSNSTVWWKSQGTDNTTFPNKWSVISYLQDVIWNVQSSWNPTGLTASEVLPRCEFLTSSGNISTYCSQMPTFMEANTVLPTILQQSRSAIPSFINTNDSRIVKRDSNGYLFDNPDSALTLYTRVFPKETFSGSTTWNSSTTFNANQVFSLLFTFFEARSKTHAPTNPSYGDLDNLTSNEKSWLIWDVMAPAMMGDEKDLFRPLVNFLDSPSTLR